MLAVCFCELQYMHSEKQKDGKVLGLMTKNGLLKSLSKNHEYILYYAKTLLRQRVAGSYLGILWLYIQPFMFMLIYSFVVTNVFNQSTPNFNIFVLIGLNAWTLFQRTLMIGATAIVRNKSIFQQVYFHKFVYPTIYLISYVYEFLISSSLVFIMMAFAGVPFTWHIIEFIPVLFCCILLTYAFTLVFSHIGVYLYDLANILEFTLRFLFYLTPIMWSLERLEGTSFAMIMKFNPMASIINSFRDCLMYGRSPDYLALLIISVCSCIVILIGYKLISKYEDAYARII